MAGRQGYITVAPSLYIHLAFQRWRCRGQDDRKLAQGTESHGHVAGVIGDPVFLLESGFMLFIHNDQSRIGPGQKQCGTGANHDLHVVT